MSLSTKKYQDQVAWITGAGSGIGRALALYLAQKGGHVALSGRRRERLEEVASEITRLGGRALVLPLDVSDAEACHSAVKEILAHFGRLDTAIANAGYGVVGTIESVPPERWRQQLDVNVLGVIHTIQAALPALRETQGRIALISSVMGLLTLPKQGPYAASKFAVRAIGLTLAQELHGSGVSATTIYPGFVASEIGRVDQDGHFDPERVDKRPARLMWSSDRAARTIWPAIMARKREFVFTGHGRVAGFLGQHAPGLIHLFGTKTRG